MKEKVTFFDTTLRDGEQSPGCGMSVNSKVLIAKQLESLGIDVIESGFPVASKGDFDSVSEISRKIKESKVCALSRTKKEDIETALRALEKAESKRIHIFVATSEVHMEKKLRKSPQEILEMVHQSISLAKRNIGDIQFSPEDAGRTGRQFLKEVSRVAIEAGATTINIPDTVGYNIGKEYYELIKFLRKEICDSIVISAHCHNDLGFAVSNTLDAVEAGARQVEGCMLGIGERAGNAQLEAVAMALKTRADYYGLGSNIKTREIGKTARMISNIIGKQIPDNLPIVGSNVFAHSAGIHQHGVLGDKKTYEIMSSADVGWEGESTPLTKHSGKHALSKRLKSMGYDFSLSIEKSIYGKMTELADSKAYVYNKDLHLIVQEVLVESEAKKDHLLVVEEIGYCRSKDGMSAKVSVSRNGSILIAEGSGDGPVASIWDAILRAVDLPSLELKDFNIIKSTGGVEAVGLVNITVENEDCIGYGRGSDTDIVLASAKAMVKAINHLLHSPVKK